MAAAECGHGEGEICALNADGGVVGAQAQALLQTPEYLVCFGQNAPHLRAGQFRKLALGFDSFVELLL